MTHAASATKLCTKGISNCIMDGTQRNTKACGKRMVGTGYGLPSTITARNCEMDSRVTRADRRHVLV
jgi:hypothetical protein